MSFRFLLPLLFIVALSSYSHAQQFEIFGGINSNHLFDSNENSTFQSGKGYTIGFSFDNPNMNGIASRLTVSYNTVQGSASTVQSLGTDGTTFTKAEIEKNSISVALYPFTFIVQKVFFSFGLQGNLHLSNSTLGEVGSNGLSGSTTMELSDATEPQFHKDFGFGVTMRVHYNFLLNNGLSIIPQYNLYYGIGEEYSTLESEKIKVWQQVFAIGIGMQF